MLLDDGGRLDSSGALTVWESGEVLLEGGSWRFDSTLVTNHGQIEFDTGTLMLSDDAGYTVGAGAAFVEELIGDTAIVLNQGKSFRFENTLTGPAGAGTLLGGSLRLDDRATEYSRRGLRPHLGCNRRPIVVSQHLARPGSPIRPLDLHHLAARPRSAEGCVHEEYPRQSFHRTETRSNRRPDSTELVRTVTRNWATYLLAKYLRR